MRYPLAEALRAVDFVSLDLETANGDPATICQVGIATVQAGRITDVWTQLIRPAAQFDRRHIEDIDALGCVLPHPDFAR